MNKQQQKNREEAIAKLREMLKPGDEIRTVLRHVSRSGMSRSISTIIDGEDWTYFTARALGLTIDQRNGGAKVGGCGMDMGFHLVYELSYKLFPDGFTCTGRDSHPNPCPSNDHSNGDRDYTPHQHKSGGYALRHRWL